MWSGEERAQFNAKPPSYALESDDEEDAVGYGEESFVAGSSRPDALRRDPLPDPVVTIPGVVAGPGSKAVVCLVGEPGEALAPHFVSASHISPVLLDDVQVGVVLQQLERDTDSSTVVVLDSSLPYQHHHFVAAALLKSLSPLSLVVVSTYHLGSHIFSSPLPSLSDAPLLRLQTGSSSPSVPAEWDQLEPPNLHHGLGASLISLADISAVPSTLILIPTTTPPQQLGKQRPEQEGDLHLAALRVATAMGWSKRWIVQADPLRRISKASTPKVTDWLEKKRRDKVRQEVGSMYL